MKDKQKKVEQYFADELSEQEKTALEQRLLEDSELANAFKLEKDLMDGIEAFGNDQLRVGLQKIHQEEIVFREKPKERYFRRIHLWAVAAVLVFGLLGLIWWLTRSPALTAEHLYAEYATYSFDFTEKGGEEELLFRVENFLDQKEYHKALSLLEKYIIENPESYQLKLAAGVAMIETGENMEEALELFEEVANQGSALKNEALWYSGLAHLKQGDLVASLDYLSQIPIESARYKKASNLSESISALLKADE